MTERISRVEVCDTGGRIVLSTALSENGLLDLTGRPQGWYVLRVYYGTGMITKKICVDRAAQR